VPVFEMLAELICSEEFFGLIAFTEFMDISQMLDPSIPRFEEERDIHLVRI
jgi:hypothetical protein